ncbi:MAG: bifunctional pyr operon transcriptional regulator/uracil phosphoribosyltransferase PyrR [Endomicrobiia bacterium]
MKTIITEKEIAKIIKNLAIKLIKKYKNLNKVGIIGIYTNGVFIAKRLIEEIKNIRNKEIQLGYLDITFYRDDLRFRKEISQPKETRIDFDVNDKDIILVDDVLYTGRTIRAAIEQVLEIGRPKSISVLVLIDRGLRELPIFAEFVGKEVRTKKNQHIEILLKETGNLEDKVVMYTKKV